MNYQEKLKENVDKNYNEFREEELKNSEMEIFDNALQIYFYSELHYFFMEDQCCDENICKLLCKDGDIVLDVLYSEFLNLQSFSVSSWDDIHSSLEDYYNTHNQQKEM